MAENYGSKIRIPSVDGSLRASTPASFIYKAPAKQPKTNKRFGKTSREYALATTAHGFSYIAEDGQSVIERIFWTIVVILGFAFTVFQMNTLYHQWQDDPVITTLDSAGGPKTSHVNSMFSRTELFIILWDRS